MFQLLTHNNVVFLWMRVERESRFEFTDFFLYLQTLVGSADSLPPGANCSSTALRRTRHDAQDSTRPLNDVADCCIAATSGPLSMLLQWRHIFAEPPPQEGVDEIAHMMFEEESKAVILMMVAVFETNLLPTRQDAQFGERTSRSFGELMMPLAATTSVWKASVPTSFSL